MLFSFSEFFRFLICTLIFSHFIPDIPVPSIRIPREGVSEAERQRLIAFQAQVHQVTHNLEEQRKQSQTMKVDDAKELVQRTQKDSMEVINMLLDMLKISEARFKDRTNTAPVDNSMSMSQRHRELERQRQREKEAERRKKKERKEWNKPFPQPKMCKYPGCGKTFMNNNNLTGHESSHTGQNSKKKRR